MTTNEVPLDEWSSHLTESERIELGKVLFEAGKAVARVWDLTSKFEAKYGEANCPHVGNASTDMAVTITEDELEGRKVPTDDEFKGIAANYLLDE